MINSLVTLVVFTYPSTLVKPRLHRCTAPRQQRQHGPRVRFTQPCAQLLGEHNIPCNGELHTCTKWTVEGTPRLYIHSFPHVIVVDYQATPMLWLVNHVYWAWNICRCHPGRRPDVGILGRQPSAMVWQNWKSVPPSKNHQQLNEVRPYPIIPAGENVQLHQPHPGWHRPLRRRLLWQTEGGPHQGA